MLADFKLKLFIFIFETSPIDIPLSLQFSKLIFSIFIFEPEISRQSFPESFIVISL